MQKRKLDIDHLTVESFETGDAAAVRGTVRAHGQSEPFQCASGAATCLETCEAGVGTCGLSCNPSCVVTWCGCNETDNCA
ncbi:hypothetical protein SAMN05216486_11218 [bacterium JGI 053]|nr:hypothetical protein SAMN05216486_11218 [bacterium JGI 053]